VGLTKSSTPVTPSDRNNTEFGEDDGTTNGSGDFLGALDTQTDVSLEISDGDECLETGTLTGTGLLLDRHDFHDFILELGKEGINDLVLFDGKREKIDFFHGLDFAILYETAEFSDGDPKKRCEIRLVSDAPDK
jgi:hypothetical protein